MKKILSLFFLVSIICISANAQHFGVRAGGLLSRTMFRSDTYTENTRVKPGFIIGAAVDIPLKNTMALNTSLNFKALGTWIIYGDDLMVIRQNYIDLDVTYEYIFHISELEFFAQGGGYLAFCVGGKVIDKPENGDKTDRKLEVGTSNTDDIKPMDAGLIIGGGIYFGKVRFSASYQFGLANLSNTDNEKIKNRAGVLTCTYFFNR